MQHGYSSCPTHAPGQHIAVPMYIAHIAADPELTATFHDLIGLFRMPLGVLLDGNGFALLLPGATEAQAETCAQTLIGAFRPGERFAFWLPALCWHAGHALFHIWEVIVGICGPEALVVDFAGVTLPAIVIAVLVWFTRHEPRPA